MILGVPIFDMLLVVYIRYRRGIPIMQGSLDHFALRLRKWRLSVEQTVIACYIASTLLGLVSLVVTRVSTNWVITISSVILAICLSIGYYLKRIDMSL
jgi:UDP-GlcNAc:undecaprenyl-phosphate GlcNAc-1-phosphate transferase